jgi:hypothetical protein
MTDHVGPWPPFSQVEDLAKRALSLEALLTLAAERFGTGGTGGTGKVKITACF